MDKLEKEIQAQLEALGMGHGGWGDGLTDEQLRVAFEYFWELGFRAGESCGANSITPA